MIHNLWGYIEPLLVCLGLFGLLYQFVDYLEHLLLRWIKYQTNIGNAVFTLNRVEKLLKQLEITDELTEEQRILILLAIDAINHYLPELTEADKAARLNFFRSKAGEDDASS